jgi:hypothetical protein
MPSTWRPPRSRGRWLLWREIRCPYWSARTLDTSAALADRAGDPATARRARTEARAVRREADLPEPCADQPDPYRGLSALS